MDMLCMCKLGGRAMLRWVNMDEGGRRWRLALAELSGSSSA